MATRKPTNPPPKPQIFPGDSEGIPTPRYLDSIEMLNELNRQRVEADTAGANKHEAMLRAQRRQAQERDLGRTPKIGLDELVETDIEYRGRRIHTTAADNRSWVIVGGIAEGSMRASYDAVTLVPFEDQYDNSYSEVIYWREISKVELAENLERVEKDEADSAEIEAARALAKSIISKSKRYAYTDHPPLITGIRDITLDDVERAMAETGAKVTIVGTNGLLVHAARQEELIAAIPKDAPKFTAKQFTSYTAQVHALMGYLDALGPLAVAWARLGKRPASDVDAKQLANRVTTGGVFVH